MRFEEDKIKNSRDEMLIIIGILNMNREDFDNKISEEKQEIQTIRKNFNDKKGEITKKNVKI